MGAKKGLAWSLAHVVLLLIMVPVATAKPLTEVLNLPVDDAEQAADDAQETAEGTKTGAEKVAEKLRVRAEDQALAAYDAASAGAVGAWTAIEAGVRQAFNDALRLLGEATGPIQKFFIGNAKADDSVSTQSSQTIVRPDNVGTSLLVFAAGTGASLLLLWLARRLIMFGVVPLLSRIAHSEIYENSARRTVGDLVVAEPGLCLNDLVSRTGFSRNAVSYHLFVLEKEDEIVSVKDGKYRRYFTRNGKYVNGAKNVVAALRNETTLKLAQVVAQRPGAIQRELCIELGATPSATCWHAKRLLELGIIRKQKVSNTVQYFPGEALVKYDLGEFGLPRIAPAPTPLIA